jgi:hypothetical protein
MTEPRQGLLTGLRRSSAVLHIAAKWQAETSIQRVRCADLGPGESYCNPLVWDCGDLPCAIKRTARGSRAGDKSRFIRDHHKLGSVARLQFHENPADVGLRRRRAHVEGIGQLLIRHPLGHQAKDLAFSSG